MAVLIVHSVFASDTVSVTLQNGLDGYTGCSDTYIQDQKPNAINANKKVLLNKNELCTS